MYQVHNVLKLFDITSEVTGENITSLPCLHLNTIMSIKCCITCYIYLLRVMVVVDFCKNRLWFHSSQKSWIWKKQKQKTLLNFFYLVSSSIEMLRISFCIKGKLKVHDLAVHIKYIFDLLTFHLNVMYTKAFDVQRKKKEDVLPATCISLVEKCSIFFQEIKWVHV